MLNNAIEVLNEREKMIFMRRNLSEKKATLDDLSIELRISKERIRQIEEQSFNKIKTYVIGCQKK
jgi:RNA polymerase sigma-32 factor